MQHKIYKKYFFGYVLGRFNAYTLRTLFPKIAFYALFILIFINYHCETKNQINVEYIPESMKNIGIYWGINRNKVVNIFNENKIEFNIEDAIKSDSCISDLKIIFFRNKDKFLDTIYDTEYVLYFSRSKLAGYTIDINCLEQKSQCLDLMKSISNIYRCNIPKKSSSEKINYFYVNNNHLFVNKTYLISDKSKSIISCSVKNSNIMQPGCM